MTKVKLIPQDPPRLNRLLNALWPTEGQGWLSQLQPVEMGVGKLLFGSGDVLRHLYFPTTAVVSLLTALENGDTAETAVSAVTASWACRCSWAARRR